MAEPNPVFNEYREIQQFIEHYEELQLRWDFRMIFITPGWKDWLFEIIPSRFQGDVLPISCYCTCQENIHEHYILQLPKNFNYNSARCSAKRFLARRGLPWPEMFNSGNALANSSGLMNKILYILGPDSRNYKLSNGFAKIVRDAHTQQWHPFNGLPNRAGFKNLRAGMIEGDTGKQRDLFNWRAKMAAGRNRARQRRAFVDGLAPRT